MMRDVMTSGKRQWWVGVAVVLALAGPAEARSEKRAHGPSKTAAEPDPSDKAEGAASADSAPSAPGPNDIVPQRGPQTIDLGNNLTLMLPEGYLFLDKANAAKMMERAGNKPDDDTVGVIARDGASWWILVSYDAEGYIKDDDAQKMDNDEILKTIKDGTEAANKYRQERGFPAVHVDGWTESPHYDRSVHHLVWAIQGTSSRGSSVNFNTRVLGRYGYASLNLIDRADRINDSKVEVQKMLAATTFNSGARYQDVDVKHDKVAEYGLAALVAGGAGAVGLKLVKVGLLAKFGGKLIALLIAGKKALVLLFVGAGAGIKRLLGIKKKAPPAWRPSDPTAPDEPPPGSAP